MQKRTSVKAKAGAHHICTYIHSQTGDSNFLRKTSTPPPPPAATTIHRNNEIGSDFDVLVHFLKNKYFCLVNMNFTFCSYKLVAKVNDTNEIKNKKNAERRICTKTKRHEYKRWETCMDAMYSVHQSWERSKAEKCRKQWKEATFYHVHCYFCSHFINVSFRGVWVFVWMCRNKVPLHRVVPSNMISMLIHAQWKVSTCSHTQRHQKSLNENWEIQSKIVNTIPAFAAANVFGHTHNNNNPPCKKDSFQFSL